MYSLSGFTLNELHIWFPRKHLMLDEQLPTSYTQSEGQCGGDSILSISWGLRHPYLKIVSQFRSAKM